MKRPEKPKAPIKPKNTIRDYGYLITDREQDLELEELIAEAEKEGFALKDLCIEVTEASFGSAWGSERRPAIDVTYSTEIPNEKFEEQMLEYEKDLKVYKARLLKYEAEMTEYNRRGEARKLQARRTELLQELEAVEKQMKEAEWPTRCLTNAKPSSPPA